MFLVPLPEGFTRTFGKAVECPQSMSLCQGLPGALETRVTFSEGMYSLFALLAMSAAVPFFIVSYFEYHLESPDLGLH